MAPSDAKSELRARMRRQRRDRDGAAARAAGESLRDHVMASPVADCVGEGTVVAGYWPMDGEIDVRPLMAALADRGAELALPAVRAKARPLVFRRWRDGDALESGPLGTRHPAAQAGERRPDVVLVPLLAFDADGFRVGYGGGFYDRTLAELRRTGAVVAVGIAYADQEVLRVPREAHDVPLDWMATEAGIAEVHAAPPASSVKGIA